MRKFFLLSFAVGVLVAPALSEAQTKPDIVGTYKCEGNNPNGSLYKGYVEIAAVRETYRIKWTLDDFSVLGVGILNDDGYFVASYFGGAPAVVIYKVDGDRLVGEWTMGGIEGRTYREELNRTTEAVPTPAHPPVPRQNPSRPLPGQTPVGIQL